MPFRKGPPQAHSAPSPVVCTWHRPVQICILWRISRIQSAVQFARFPRQAAFPASAVSVGRIRIARWKPLKCSARWNPRPRAGTILFPGHVGALDGVCRCPVGARAATWEARQKGHGTPAEAAEACQKSGERPLHRHFHIEPFFCFSPRLCDVRCFRTQTEEEPLALATTSHSQSPARGRDFPFLVDAEISQCGQRARGGRGPGAPSQEEKGANCAGTVATAESSQVRSETLARLAQQKVP